MPAYEYIERGRTVIRVLPVADRDKFPGRVVIPRRVMVCPRGEPSQADQVIKGFYACEQKYGTARVRLTEKALGMNASNVKAVWNRPD
jgi:hypothetical protein